MARRLFIRLDPDSARRRKEAARRHAQVRRFAERSGNAGMIAHELPTDEVLASWQHVEQRALDLRAAGVPGNLQDLRVRAYLDLLQERDTRTALTPDQDQDDAPDQTCGSDGSSQDSGPSLAALVTITVPLATLEGGSDEPGTADGFGPLDAETARALAAAAARNPPDPLVRHLGSPDATAAAHACAPGARHGPPGPRTLKYNVIIRGPCNHAQVQHIYRPSRKLRHLVNARNTTCTAPGCNMPAARCDLDHTDPWHHSGPTCPCNLAPTCKS